MLESEPKPFLCKGCHDLIRKPHNFSKDPTLCIYCYREKQYIERNECVSCGGPDPEKVYWGRCEKCFFKEVDEEEEFPDEDEDWEDRFDKAGVK